MRTLGCLIRGGLRNRLLLRVSYLRWQRRLPNSRSRQADRRPLRVGRPHRQMRLAERKGLKRRKPGRFYVGSITLNQPFDCQAINRLAVGSQSCVTGRNRLICKDNVISLIGAN